MWQSFTAASDLFISAALRQGLSFARVCSPLDALFSSCYLVRPHNTAGRIACAAPRFVVSSLQLGTTMDAVTRQHSASCPLASKARLHKRFHSRATPGCRQPATPILSKAPNAQAAPANTVSSGTNRRLQQRLSSVACSAVAPPSAAAAAPAQIDSVPRGETAGANLILENATVQAGHRDLLEVSRNLSVLPQAVLHHINP